MTILDEIVANKRRERMGVVPLTQTPEPSDRSLFDALSRAHCGWIMEVKKASPSRGLIRANFDIDAIVSAYNPHADAISVLTDHAYFQGSMEVLSMVRERTDHPILCKDFIVEPSQIVEARSAGADAVLLMLSVLNDKEYRDCAAVAHRFGMDVLTEVHDEQEMARALALDATIIGINNRNLKDLTIDLDVTRRLAPLVPPDRLVIGESGLNNHHDARDLRTYVDGFLVGTGLISRRRIDRGVRELVYGPVKVCGLRTAQQANMVQRAGAVWGGLIFYPPSPRYLSFEAAEQVVRGCPEMKWVGVFVDEDIQTMVDVAHRLKLSALQLHGSAPSDVLLALSGLLPDCEIWTRWSPEGPDDQPPSKEQNVNRVLCDATDGTRIGGTGHCFDWRCLDGLSQRQHLVLAGGLSAANAPAADSLAMGLLDVNSGVEQAPGIKDAAKVRAFFSALRGKGRNTA